MIRKILLFLLGMGLGVLLVYFFFGDRDIQCSYFPNDRVLYDLRKKQISLDEGVSRSDTSGLRNALEYGDVNFELSNTKKEGCKDYRIELDEKNKYFHIENCDSTATILEVGGL